MKDVKYIVKPEEKIVIGITEPVYLFGKYVSRIPKRIEELFSILYLITMRGYEDGVKAIARCNEDDEWDERIGKDLVDQKLELKKTYKILRHVWRMKDTLTLMEGYLDEIIKENVDKINKLNDDIERHFLGKVG